MEQRQTHRRRQETGNNGSSGFHGSFLLLVTCHAKRENRMNGIKGNDKSLGRHWGCAKNHIVVLGSVERNKFEGFKENFNQKILKCQAFFPKPYLITANFPTF
jgi:hypothetical protein